MNDEFPDLDITRVFFESVNICVHNGILHFDLPAYRCRQCGFEVVKGFDTTHKCTSWLN